MLELRGVGYRYPGFERRALDGVDLAISDGEIVGLTGPNGAGKSTLCLVAAGVAPGSIGGELAGDVLLDGRPLRGRRSYELASSIGIVLSNPDAQRTRIAATVFEEVAFGPTNLGVSVAETVSRVRSALGTLGIEHLAERHPGRLSGGETQLVAIASVLALRPRHLVMDEPVAELDPEGRGLVTDALRRVAAAGTGLLVAEHDLDLLSALGSRVVALKDGRIAPGARHAAEPRSASTTANVALEAPIAIRCAGLAFEYADGTRALDGVDLSIRMGESVAIVGRNGSGKTTLVRTWNGLLGPASGRVEIGGSATDGRRVSELARIVGMTFQDPHDQLFGRTCHDEVAFGARNVGLRGHDLDAAKDEALEAVGLSSEAATNPFDLGSSRQRLLAIASVLSMRTPVVVLDEPTIGLDVDERARVQAIVRRLAGEGRTVVAISHDARFVADSFEREIRLDRGRVIADGPAAPDR